MSRFIRASIIATAAAAVFAPERAYADCCSFESAACTARAHTLPQCAAGTQVVDGDVDDLTECWTLGFIAINPLDPLTYLIALAAGELYCDGAGDTACSANLTDAQCADTDADGLLDDWEINGVDVDSDGTIDVDLPAFGADPNHKDLFVEMDVMAGEEPSQQDIADIKAAFAAAPINAGGTANPDGTAGINLWIDTGNVADPLASEDGAFPGSCADSIDNGGDGAGDGNDSDCWLGDNFGGGNQLGVSSICNLDASFFASKGTNFAAARAQVFRYAVSAQGCDADTDGFIDSGGWGEIGGNDFIEYNHDGGTIMHELGHNLNLQHGGNVGDNCKPNYVSVMNYDQQFGINQLGGGAILDFSPPRFVGGRGFAPLPTLVENALDENVVLDPTDPSNQFIFVDAAGNKVRAPLNLNPDWSGDAADPPFESGITLNIDTASSAGNPGACTNNSSSSTLTGHDDWNVISLPFTQFADSASGGVNVVTQPEPTLQELVALEVELNTTDLAVTKTASVDPVIAGTALDYVIVVANHGPNPASEIILSENLPSGTVLVAAEAGCVEAPAGVLSCELPELLAGETISLTVRVLVDPGLVYYAGGPTTIVNECAVENLRGPDVDGSDNIGVIDTGVIAVADLGVHDFVVADAPVQALAADPVDVLTSKVMTSAGPSSPMDGEASAAVLAPAGSSGYAVTPTSVVAALLTGEQRPGTESFVITCGAPGSQTFGFETAIEPLLPADSDPDLSNNDAATQHTLDCVIPVAININPHRANNAIELNGAIEVAVLTTLAGEYDLPLPVDATQIDPSTVRFGLRDEVWEETGGAAPHQGWFQIKRSYELDDVTRDADHDMLLKLQGPDTGLTSGSVEACAKGELVSPSGDRYRFFGCAEVVPLGGP
jgi:uncharacterized repeat protein (TIGR01451 family)